MADLAADPAALLRAAAVLRTLAAEYRDQPLTRYWMAPEETGHDDLAAALAEFQQAADGLARHLPEDLTDIAYRLAGTAAGYQHADTAVADQLRHGNR